MKKFIYKISLTIAASAACVSCSFLDEVPPSNLVSEQIYSDEETAKATLDGCYQGLVYLISSHFINTMHGASILQHTQQTQVESWFNHTIYSNHTANSNVYQRVYGQIGKQNSFIDGVNASAFSQETKEKMIAHARFLRAYTYFFATRLWGDVPLILDRVVSLSQAEILRTPYQKVYKAILDDLTYAENHLPGRSQLSEKELRSGYVCDFAATALKSKVYVQIASLMTSAAKGLDDQWFDLKKEGRYPDFSECGIPKNDVKKAWTLALESSEKVINEGPYELEPDYANLFRFLPDEHPEDYLSKERILVVPASTGVTGGTYAYASWSLPKQPYGSSETTTDNGNKLRIRPSRFTWETWCEKYGANSDYKEESDSELGDFTFYRGCADPRLDASYYYGVYYTGTSKSTNRCYPDKSRVAFWSTSDISTTNTTESLNCTPIYKKGFSKSYRGQGSAGDADVYLFRFADVILLAAEAAANLDDPGKAIGYVNRILDRARNSTNKSELYPHTFGDLEPAAAPAAWKVSQYTDKNELILAILWERVFEMDYEFHSFFDTRRYGATFYIENFVKPYNMFMHTTANYRMWKLSPMCLFGRDKAEDMATVRAGLLIAYPEYEILNNKKLDYKIGQNDFFIE